MCGTYIFIYKYIYINKYVYMYKSKTTLRIVSFYVSLFPSVVDILALSHFSRVLSPYTFVFNNRISLGKTLSSYIPVHGQRLKSLGNNTRLCMCVCVIYIILCIGICIITAICILHQTKKNR